MFYRPNKQKLGINIKKSRELINTTSPPFNISGMLVKARSYVYQQTAGYIPTYTKMTTDIPVTPVVLTGTIELTDGSRTVDGTGTLFTTELEERRDQIRIDGYDYYVAKIDSDTRLYLDNLWEHGDDSGLSVYRLDSPDITEKLIPIAT